MNSLRIVSLVIGILLISPACSQRPSEAPLGSTLRIQSSEARYRAMMWLKDQQAADGGWHSSTYGPLKGGVGNTALILYALSLQSAAERHLMKAEIDRAFRFLLSNLDESGHVRAADNSADYPTYATALALVAMVRMNPTGWFVERGKMQTYLLQSQSIESNPNSHHESERGGWNQTGGSAARKVHPGDTNISVTSFVLEALSESAALTPIATEAAKSYLRKCQNFSSPAGDGGFYYTPHRDDPRNKAGTVNHLSFAPRAISYDTATLDGLTSLALLDIPPSDPYFVAALHWLRTKRLETLPADDRSPLDGLRYYRYAAATRCQRFSTATQPTCELLLNVPKLLSEQLPNGSWKNPNTLVREDDPLIATALALCALSPRLPTDSFQVTPTR